MELNKDFWLAFFEAVPEWPGRFDFYVVGTEPDNFNDRRWCAESYMPGREDCITKADYEAKKAELVEECAKELESINTGTVFETFEQYKIFSKYGRGIYKLALAK